MGKIQKLSVLSKVSLLLAGMFAIDKLLGVIRQLIISRTFGLSAEFDVFNAANNLPDMLFSLISGGALAIAIIPILSDLITDNKKEELWKLFSNVINIAFLLTLLFSIIITIFSEPIVKSQIGVAPGFTVEQQGMVITLMRLNLLSTIIFSISGLFMAGLQANKKFLMPALAPIFYDLGQIFGALILAPEQGFSLGSFQLPAFGFGIQGLVYGTIIGALFHFLIQIPTLYKLNFRHRFVIEFKDPKLINLVKIIRPRILSMIAIQLIFLIQDNIASRLEASSISALSYGWLIMQVPETLIGTSIATALLPTLSEYVSSENWEKFYLLLQNSIKLITSLCLPITVILSLGLLPVIDFAFGFDRSGSLLVFATTRAFMLGLVAHSMVELFVRAFYSLKKPLIPLLAIYITLIVYFLSAIVLTKIINAPGLALANSIAYFSQAVMLFFLFNKTSKKTIFKLKTVFKPLLISMICGVLILGFQKLNFYIISPFLSSILIMLFSGVICIIFLRKDYQLLISL